MPKLSINPDILGIELREQGTDVYLFSGTTQLVQFSNAYIDAGTQFTGVYRRQKGEVIACLPPDIKTVCELRDK